MTEGKTEIQELISPFPRELGHVDLELTGMTCATCA